MKFGITFRRTAGYAWSVLMEENMTEAWEIFLFSFVFKDRKIRTKCYVTVKCFLCVPLLTYLLTYSTEQSPSWEANWFCSQSRNSPHFWNLKVHHRTHKCPQPVPILSQLHPIPTTLSHFLKIYLNIILPSASGSPQWSLSLRFPH